MFADSKLTERWPHNQRPRSEYFPTEVSLKSIDFGVIEQKPSVVEIVETALGIHSLEINDYPWFWSSARSQQYVNPTSHRKITDKESLYEFVGGEDRRLLKMYMFGVGEDHTIKTRKVIQLVDSVSQIGGLMSPIMTLTLLLSTFFAAPYRGL